MHNNICENPKTLDKNILMMYNKNICLCSHCEKTILTGQGICRFIRGGLMNNYEIPPHEKRVMEKALERLSPKKESSTALFVVMLILYISASVFVTVSARMQAIVNVAGDVIPLYTFTGVFSSLSNICVIFMTVYCGKKGYFTSLILMVIQLPMLFIGIFVRHNVTSLPGVFGSILTISAMTIIYITNRKVKQSEDEIRRQAVTDMLTGLPNVYACTKMLIELIEKKETFTNVTININGFKNLNDTMGFDIGNKVIMEAGLRWNEIAVSGQTGTQDFIAHLSGDEFALIIDTDFNLVICGKIS